MKRLFLLLLCFSLLAGLLGCASLPGSNQKETVTFYYLRKEVDFSSNSPLITAEVRDELSGSDTLEYLLAHYMNGPIDDKLYFPAPSTLRVEKIQQKEDILFITFNSVLSDIQGYDLTKICACFAMTCMELTDAKYVTIYALDSQFMLQTIAEFSADELFLFDNTSEFITGGS